METIVSSIYLKINLSEWFLKPIRVNAIYRKEYWFLCFKLTIEYINK